MLGSTSDGDAAVGMGRGQISNLLMELAGIDIAEALKFMIEGDRKIPIRCAFGDFSVADGVMTTRALAFDTTDTIIVGDGTHQPEGRNAEPETAATTEGPQPAGVPLAADGGRHVQGPDVPSGPRRASACAARSR